MKVAVLAAVLLLGLVLGALAAWATLRAPAQPPAVLNYGAGCPQGYVPMMALGRNAAGPCRPGAKCDWCVRRDLVDRGPFYLPAQILTPEPRHRAPECRGVNLENIGRGAVEKRPQRVNIGLGQAARGHRVVDEDGPPWPGELGRGRHIYKRVAVDGSADPKGVLGPECGRQPVDSRGRKVGPL